MKQNPQENAPEKILTKEEVMGVILKFAENAEVVRELSDEKGALYLLEAKIEGEKPGEIIQFEYIRKGRFSKNYQSSRTTIYKTHFQDEIPVGGEEVAVYNDVTGQWES